MHADADADATPQHPGGWPLPERGFDPIVADMPESEQTQSIEAVGAYLAARITDKKQLVKALHDYVVIACTTTTTRSS